MIRCLNNDTEIEVPAGSTLMDVFGQSGLQMQYGPICAHVNNKVEGMHYRFYNPKTVEFLDITSNSGLRTYTRTLFFVLCKAVHDLYTTAKVAIDIPVSNGYYVNLNIGHPVTAEDAQRIRHRMEELIDAALPIHRHNVSMEEAIRMFTELHTYSKVKLLKGVGSLYTIVYELDGYYDYYYSKATRSAGDSAKAELPEPVRKFKKVVKK